jgi:hypothetical protein
LKVTVQIRGLEQLKAELQRLSATTAARLSKNAAMAGARVAARRAKALVPVDTGKLRASIKAMRPPGGQQAGQRVALAGSKLFYSRFIELVGSYGALSKLITTRLQTGERKRADGQHRHRLAAHHVRRGS